VPTYEYECRKCGHRFEVFQSMKDEALKVCEECGGEVRRLVSGGAGIIFKGSGFYQTDYRSESYQKKAKEESSAAKPAEPPKADAPKKDPPASGGSGGKEST